MSYSLLLNNLIKDEKKIDRFLYGSGSYWQRKAKRALFEIEKSGIKDFRGMSSSIGSSYADNIILDVRNEYNIKGRLVGKFFSLPLIKRVFDAQLKVTKTHIDAFLKANAVVYKNNPKVIKLLNKYEFKNTTDFGCVSHFQYEDQKYSCIYLNMADCVSILSKAFDFTKIRNYFEIGGGFGANIHFLIQNFPNIRKVIYLDIVPNIFVGTEYLKFHFGSKVKDYNDLRGNNKIEFSDSEELEILCIPPWSIEKLRVSIDHFHNANSFVEMPPHVIENYIKFIEKFNVKGISLLSYDSYDPKTTINPESLNEYFGGKLKTKWEDALIDEYGRQVLYLTSY